VTESAGTRPRLLVAEPDDFSSAARQRLERTCDVELRRCSAAELGEAFTRYDAIWFRLGHRVRAEHLPPRPRARVLATPVTGLDHIDLEACAAAGIRVVSLRGETEFLRSVRATAELTIALLLALLRRLPAASRSVEQGHWDRDAFRGREIHGHVAGVVGMGRLGSLVAEYLGAFGARVVGYDPRPDFPLHLAARADSLGALLSKADIVTLHASYGTDSHDLLGQAEFDVLKPGAFLVNTARGGLIDEDALLKALVSGRLSGAALDVLKGEPELAASHPLVEYARAHDNLVIVPHIGGNTFESFEKTEVFLAGRVLAALGLDAPA